MEKEKDKRVKLRQDKNNLDKMYKSAQKQLSELQNDWLELNKKTEEQEVVWENERVRSNNRIKELKEKVEESQTELSRIDQMHEELLESKKKEITDLESRLKLRHSHFKNVKSELENKKEEMKDIQESLDIMKNRAEKAEKMVEELKKEKKGLGKIMTRKF